MSLLSRLKRPGPSGFGYGSTADEVTRGLSLSGQRVLVTGANSGLGLETARALAARGATVVAAARTLDKAQGVVQALGGAVEPVACELSEPASVRSCVAALRDGPPLSAIICNAGIMALPQRQLQHGVEAQLFTNHVGHFMLVTGLLESLTAAARVVMVSSSAHRRAPAEGIRLDDLAADHDYTPWGSYGQSKLANLLFARELNRRLPPAQLALALHPGVINTALVRHLNPMVNLVWKAAGPVALKSIPQGAATQCWAAVHPDAAAHGGRYLANCNVARSTDLGRDMPLAARLWQVTEELVAGL